MTQEEITRLEIQEKKSSIFSNWASFGSSLTIIITIGFAFFTYKQTAELRKQEVTIDLLNELRTPEFLNRLKNLKGIVNVLETDSTWEFRPRTLEKLQEIYEDPNIGYLELRQKFRDDVFYTFNIYENIALLSNRGVIDQKTIYDFTSSEICRFLILFKKDNGRRILEKNELPKSMYLREFLISNNSDCVAVGNNYLWEEINN